MRSRPGNGSAIPPLRNLERSGLARTTSYVLFQQTGGRGGAQWATRGGSLFDFVNNSGQVLRFS